MATEDRWLDYSDHALDRGVRSTLSIPLPFQTSLVGALNNYSGLPRAFDDDAVALAEEIAVWIATPAANAFTSGDQVQYAADMRAAMVKRALIEQAKGS